MDPLRDPDLLRAIIAFLAAGYLAAMTIAITCHRDARYWRRSSQRWRSAANEYRRSAVAFRVPEKVS